MLKNLLLLSAFSTFVVIVIVGLDIYHKSQISSLPPSTQRNIVPITPAFDKETLEGLKKRAPVEVNLTEKSTIISEGTRDASTNPTPSPTNEQEASPPASEEANLSTPATQP